MTDLDRLLLEALPDGTFGGRRPEPPPRPPRDDLLVTTTEEAAHHAAILAREVAAFDEAHRGYQHQQAAHRYPAPRHLHPVPTTDRRAA